MDGIYNNEKWEALRNHVGGETGDALVKAFKELYSVYDEKMIDWYAGLYDDKVGGYYYSNSARDNEYVEENGKKIPLLPDVESTFQSINFWCGGLDGGIKQWGKWLPEWLQKKIADFAYNLQDEDGFFYHPQWGKNIEIPRRGRDYMWASYIVEHLRGELKYPSFKTAPEPKADKEENKKILIPDHLTSKEKFEKYLDSLNITERSYHSGNELAAQVDQIKAMGLLDFCCDYLTARQNERGQWHHTSNYYANDGVFKIMFLYNAAERPLPRPIEAATAAIDAIVSDEKMNCVCDLYNTWYSVRSILENARKYAGEDADRISEEILHTIWRIAPEGILNTKKKIAEFKKPDGGFSYGPHSSAPHSQGAPVAIPDSPEGDVNATNVSCSIVGNIYMALDLTDYSVPLFDPAMREKYISLLEARREKA